jgi:Aspartyl protease
MKPACSAACAAFFLSMAVAQAAPAKSGASAADPDFLFSEGLFDQARTAYEAVPQSSPRYEAALRQLGALALYQNHLAEAEAMIERARARNPADLSALALLAETKNREGKFADTAQLLRQLRRPDRAAEFALFGDAKPYRVAGHQGVVTVPFKWTEPLPAVLAEVNGLRGLFLIDTGAPEIILDPQFAHDARVDMAVPPAGTAAQKMAVLPFGRIRKFGLTGIETDDVPTLVLSTRGFSGVARNERVAGLIGTEFLSHFRPTLDYVHDRLVLEPRDAPARAGGTVADIPFWFFGDHMLLAPGRLDQGPKQLFLVNTGTSVAALLAPDSTLRDAGVAVPTLQPGKPGIPPTATFPIDRLSLGNLVESKLSGIYGSFPPRLENGLGFHIGGIVSHAFFHSYAVTFDFVRMRIDVRK